MVSCRWTQIRTAGYYATGRCHDAQNAGSFLKIISFVNWLVLTLAVLASLAGAVIFLLTWPFPQVSDEGQRFADVLVGTEMSVGVAVLAGLATWLADKRHPAYWIAEIALAVAVAAAFYYGLAQA